MKGIVSIFLFAATLGFLSCRSVKYVPIETVKTEYRTRDSIRYDSIYQRDSVFLYQKGDTVYQYKYLYKYKYLTLRQTDTVAVTDSVRVPYPVEKSLTPWQAVKLKTGGLAVGLVAVLLLIVAARLFCKFRLK